MKQSAPVLALGLFAVVAFLGIYFSGMTVEPGEFQDPDCYMRLVRVQQWMDGGSWFDQTIHRDNAPYGLEMHWSRPLDLLLRGGAFLTSWAIGSERALFISALLISPLLLFPCLLAIDSLARRFLSYEGRLLAALLFLTQPGIINYFLPARPDHHALILALVVGAVALAAQGLMRPELARSFLLAGFVMAIGHWTSVEVMVIWIVVTAGYALLWLVHPAVALNIARFQTVHLFFVFAFLMLETPQFIAGDWPLDRLSGAHLILFGTVTAAWWGLTALPQVAALMRWRGRLVTGVGAAVASLGVVGVAAPSLMRGPFGAVDPELRTVWLDHVTELHHLSPDVGSGVIGVLSWLPAMIPGLAFLVWLALQPNRRLAFGRPVVWAWAVGALLCTGLAFYQKRWVSYADLWWIVPAAAGLDRLFQSLNSRAHFRLIRPVVLLVVCGGPVLLASGLEAVRSVGIPQVTQIEDAGSSASRPVVTGRQWFSDLASIEPGTMLAFIDYGPRLLWRTPHQTLASPYHGNHLGIVETRRALSTSDVNEAAQILTRRGVKWILVTTNPSEAAFFGSGKESGSIYDLLINGETPTWAQEVRSWQVNEQIARLFRVIQI